MIHRRHSTAFALCGIALATFACGDKKSPPPPAATGMAAAQSSAPATADAGSTAAADAAVATPKAPPPCTVGAAITLDQGVRADTGITKRQISDEQMAIGYATAQGVPKVILIDHEGKITKTEVDWSHVRDKEKKKLPDMNRHLERVTPIGPNGKMFRVAMDFIDTSKEKNSERYLRCGAADQDPIIHDPTNLNFLDPLEDDILKIGMYEEAKHDQNTYDTRDCRTFTNGKEVWAVATVLRRESKDNSNVLVEWMIDETPGAAKVKEHLLDKRILKATNKKYPTMDHFLTPVSINAGDAGYIIVGREQGSLVFAHRTDKLEKIGDPVSMWLGAAVDMPGVAHDKERAFLLVTEYKKTDLFGTTWLGDKPVPKPERIALKDSSAQAAAGDREAPTISSGPDGNVFVAFTDGDSKKRHARMTVLGGDLKQKLSDVVDVSPDDVSVAETRIVALPGKRAFVTYLETTGKLTGAVVTCQY